MKKDSSVLSFISSNTCMHLASLVTLSNCIQALVVLRTLIIVQDKKMTGLIWRRSIYMHTPLLPTLPKAFFSIFLFGREVAK
jgi:hypothetical protein